MTSGSLVASTISPIYDEDDFGLRVKTSALDVSLV